MSIVEEPLSKKSRDEAHVITEYSSQDVETIIRLLTQYSDKLLKLCDRLERVKNTRRNLLFLTLSILAITILTMGLFPSVSFIFTALLGSSTIWIVLNLYFLQTRKEKVLRIGAERVFIRLKSVIRMGSQLHEHVVRNPVTHLELDFYLTDAEFACNYFDLIVEKQN